MGRCYMQLEIAKPSVAPLFKYLLWMQEQKQDAGPSVAIS